MKSISSIFDQNQGADITSENPIKVEAESFGFEDMCICPDDITGTGSVSCCIDRKDFKIWTYFKYKNFSLIRFQTNLHQFEYRLQPTLWDLVCRLEVKL